MFYRGFFLCVYSVVVKKRKTLLSFREKETVQEYNGQATGFLKNQELLIFTFSHKLIQASAPLGPGSP